MKSDAQKWDKQPIIIHSFILKIANRRESIELSRGTAFIRKRPFIYIVQGRVEYLIFQIYDVWIVDPSFKITIKYVQNYI